MPDETTKPTTSEPVANSQLQPSLSEDTKKKIEKAGTSLWKKVLYWAGGILGALAAIVGILYLFKGKGNGPINGVKNQIKDTKAEIAKSDLEKKLEVAKAEAKDEETKKKVDAIKEMDDDQSAMEELNKLIEPDSPSASNS